MSSRAFAAVALVSLLLVCARPSTADVVAATAQEQDEIQKLIDLARHATENEEYKAAKDTKTQFEGRMGIFADVFGRPERTSTPGDLAKLHIAERDAYVDAVKVYSRYETQAATAFNKAIGLTLKYYNIAPTNTSGVIRSGSPKEIGRPLTWRPIYSQTPVPHERDQSAIDPGLVAYLRTDNGLVVVRPAGVAYPGMLAMALDHESKHFDEYLTQGLDLRNEWANEVRVRQGALGKLQRIFGLAPEDWEEYLGELEGAHLLAREWDAKMRFGADPSNAIPGDFRRKLTRSEVVALKAGVRKALGSLQTLSEAGRGRISAEALARLKKDSGLRFIQSMDVAAVEALARDWTTVRERYEVQQRLQEGSLEGLRLLAKLGQIPREVTQEAGQAVARLSQQKLEREKEEARKKYLEFVEREKQWREEYARRVAQERAMKDAAWKYLKALSKAACADPKDFASSSASVPAPDVMLDRLDLVFYSTQDSGSLNSCQADLLRRIGTSQYLVPPGVIANWAAQYRAAHPNLLVRLTRGVGGLFEGIIDFLDELSRELPSSSGRSSSPRPPRDPEPRGISNCTEWANAPRSCAR